MPDVGINFRIGTRCDDGLWVGWCPCLDLATYGDTREHAREAIKEAVNLWIETCMGDGTIDMALVEAGFSRVVCRHTFLHAQALTLSPLAGGRTSDESTIWRIPICILSSRNSRQPHEGKRAGQDLQESRLGEKAFQGFTRGIQEEGARQTTGFARSIIPWL